MTYDELGRLRTRTAPDGVVTTYTYAGIELTVTTPVSASETRTTLYQYLGFGSPADAYLRTVTDAAGTVTRYRYDVLNHLIRVEVPGVPARTWTYGDDSRWLLAEETQPESGTTQYAYDAAGRLTSTTNALSETTVFHYDTSNRLEQIDPPGTEDDVTVTFHPTYGRPSGQTTASVTTAWGYDAAGRLNARSDTVNGQTFTSTYTLDTSDNLSTITYPSGRVVTYHYDTANRPTEVLQNGAVFADTFTYGDTGALASYHTGAVTHRVTYDTRDRVEQLTALTAGGAGLDLTYWYDAADQVLAITDPRSGASQSYAYDPLGRLGTATGPWGTRSWTYSPSGDRLSETAGGVTTYQYDSATQRLLSTSGAVPEVFAYDDLGRLNDDARGHYAYN